MANLYDEVKRIKAAIKNHSVLDAENEYDLAAMLAYNCDANWEFGSEEEGYCPWYGPFPKTKEMLYKLAAELYKIRKIRNNKKIGHVRRRMAKKPQAIRIRYWNDVESFIFWHCDGGDSGAIAAEVYNTMKKLRLHPELLKKLSVLCDSRA